MNSTREELLFALALTKTVVERSVWLGRECDGDPALRVRLDALLAAHERPETLLTPGTAGILAGVSKSATPAGKDARAPRFDGPVEFARDIQPLLERSCVACHSGEKPKGGFAMSDRASLLKGGARGEPVVVPGKPDAGQLIHLVQDQVEDLEMPPVAKREKFPALTKDEITKLSGWISQGANWPAGATLHAPGK